MDYSQRIEIARNRTMAEFYKYNGRTIHIPTDNSTYNQQRIGPMPIIVHKEEIFPLISMTPTDTTTTMPNPCITTVAQVFTALESLMVYNASISFPPTKSARVYYLWSFTIASAYSWVTSSQYVTGTKDSWNWDTKYIVDSDNDVFIWMTHVLVSVMSNFVPSYDTSTLLYNERMNWFIDAI